MIDPYKPPLDDTTDLLGIPDGQESDIDMSDLIQEYPTWAGLQSNVDLDALIEQSGFIEPDQKVMSVFQRLAETISKEDKFNSIHDAHGRFGSGHITSSEIPVSELSQLTTIKSMKKFGPQDGDNPRYTVDVGGQTYFVKQLKGKITEALPEDMTRRSLAARDVAVMMGLKDETIPIAHFVGENGKDYIAQPLLPGRVNCADRKPFVRDQVYDTLDALPPEMKARLVSYEYIVGTGDRHEGQYMVDPKAKHPLILTDFDMAFPEDSNMLDRPSWLMRSISGEAVHVGGMKKALISKNMVLAALQNKVGTESSVDTVELRWVKDRFGVLQKFVDKFGDETVSYSQFINFTRYVGEQTE